MWKVNKSKPVPLPQHLDSIVQGDHANLPRRNIGIQEAKVEDGAKSFVLLRNNGIV